MIEKKAHDHIFSIVKAAVNCVPGVGGAVGSLLSDYLPNATERSINNFSDQFKKRLEELEDRMSTEDLNKDDFVELVKSSLLVVMRTQKKEKIQGASKILSNLLLKAGDAEKLTYNELDHFIRALEALSIGAIQILASLVRDSKAKSINNYESKISSRVTVGELAVKIQNDDIAFIYGLLRELSSWGFVDIIVPQIGNNDLYLHPVAAMNMGERFANYVLTLEDDG